MYPPIFSTLAGSSTVNSLLGQASPRIYPVGQAPQGSESPYVVHQLVTGSPENYLGNLPDLDSYTVQFDVYAATVGDARRVALAVRDVIEPLAHVARWGGETRDDASGLCRYSFDVSWRVPR